MTALIEGTGDKTLVDITIDDGSGPAKLTATDNHPFWVPELREWVPAVKLQPGQWLQTSAGTWTQITAVTSRTQKASVNNLTVADLHTYYALAGATPVLVHNCGGTFSLGNRKWENSYGGDLATQGVEATLDRDDALEMVVRAPGGVSGLPRGSAMVTEAINAFQGIGRKVNGIRGVWNAGPLGDNLNSLNAAVRGGMSPQDAIWETFTGKFARRNGFTEASIDWESAAGGLGNHTEFVVNFMRPGS